MTGFIVSVFPFRNRVSSKEAFEGLELGERKLSRPVLRGPGGRKVAWLLGSYSGQKSDSRKRFAGGRSWGSPPRSPFLDTFWFADNRSGQAFCPLVVRAGVWGQCSAHGSLYAPFCIENVLARFCRYGANLPHCRSPFYLCFEHVDNLGAYTASLRRPAFSSHLIASVDFRIARNPPRLRRARSGSDSARWFCRSWLQIRPVYYGSFVFSDLAGKRMDAGASGQSYEDPTATPRRVRKSPACWCRGAREENYRVPTRSTRPKSPTPRLWSD